MSEPNVPDIALIQVGDGAVIEVFTTLCGIFKADTSKSAQTREEFRRDCATPFASPRRVVTVTGKQATTSGDGLVNVDQIALFSTSLGVKKNYKVIYYKEDILAPGTDGTAMGTYAGKAILTQDDESVDADSTSSKTITLEWDGVPVWTPAV